MTSNIERGQSRWSIAPYFVVDDVVSTANFYRDKLGFGYNRFWNEPPSFCMVSRSGVIIMLAPHEQMGAMRPNRMADPDGEAWDAGCRDFDVEDCNGDRLCFGQIVER